ncbi:hypothetical protein CWR43_17235 [Rhizobium sullae]|uniref:EF-hand domain-containing protein n=2 Tax=Rhizobium sullae TaxID=50338 RepID=A0A2N0D882_RHISU|nr:hypothetical protein CWR43_17235 [Rhizobium sullae]
MRIGSDNSIYSLFAPKSRKGPSVADEKIDMTPTQPPRAPPVRTDEQLVAEFYARLTKQQLDWADADNDDRVTKNEYMDGQVRLAQLNGRPLDATSFESHWTTIDPTGKGWVDEAELREGLEKMLPVRVGHLDANYAERLRTKQA